MPENTAGNHFLQVLSVLASHYSESFQVIQNKTVLMKSFVLEHENVTWGQIKYGGWPNISICILVMLTDI
jgi:hypothetical protein